MQDENERVRQALTELQDEYEEAVREHEEALEEEEEPFTPGRFSFPLTLGHMNALRIDALREKYGGYPKPNRSIEIPLPTGGILELPLPRGGREDYPVPEPLDLKTLPKVQAAMYPVNREDYRRRIRPHLPRQMRKDTYTKRLRAHSNAHHVST